MKYEKYIFTSLMATFFVKDEWINRWMNEWMNEWMNGWMKGWINARMSEWFNALLDGYSEEWEVNFDKFAGNITGFIQHHLR